MGDFIKNEAGVNVYIPGSKQPNVPIERPVSARAAETRGGIYLEVLGAGLVIAAAIGASETVFADSGPGPFENDNGTKNRVIVPPEQPPVYEISKIYPNNLELLYPGLDVYQQVSALDVSVDSAENFALSGDDVKRLKDLFPKVEHFAGKYGIPKWIMLGQIAAESKGDPVAISPAGAEGVAQIMPWLSSERGIDASDVDASLDTMGQILRDEYDRFGDWSLAVWSWHVGDGEVYRAVQLYEQSTVVDSKLMDIVVPAGKVGGNNADMEVARKREEYKQFIGASKVNVFKLIKIDAVKSRYEGPGFDLTLEYLNRIAGLSIKLEDLIEGRVQVVQEHHVE